MKAYLDNFIVTAGGTSYVAVTFIDDTNSNAFIGSQFVASDFSACTSSETIYAQAKTDVLAYAAAQGYGTTSVFGMFATNNDISTHAIEGTTTRANPIPVAKSATVASGVAVYQLTTDGLSTGTSLFPNGVIKDSLNLFVNDATSSYQMSYVFSNSDKTVTVTANKLSTANILTGVLGQTAANGAVVKLTIVGY